MPSNSTTRSVTCPYATVSAAHTASASRVRVEVSPRRASPANTSMSRMAQIATASAISGMAGARLDQVNAVSGTAASSSYFGGDRLAHQVMDGRLHDLEQRGRVHPDCKHRHGERPEHQELAPVQVV